MREQIRNRIVAVINRNCFWLEVVPEEEARTLLCTGLMQQLDFNAEDIVVRVTRNHKRYRKGRVVTITAASICESIAQMSADRAFAARANNGTLTVSDVDSLLVRASHGAMEPDLYEY